jgi:hypothetical protein
MLGCGFGGSDARFFSREFDENSMKDVMLLVFFIGSLPVHLLRRIQGSRLIEEATGSVYAEVLILRRVCKEFSLIGLES